MAFGKTLARGLAFIVPAHLLLASAAAPALAQAVVQSLPPAAANDLNEALQRLSRNPQSVPALLDAGRASLELNDVDAAEGFFARARSVEPENHRAIGGLAVATLRQDDPVAALELFQQAADAGADMDAYASDHGLAHDLIGQNVLAQALYGRALSRNENPVTVRRLSLSYAITGDRDASEAILLPLLQRRDLAAYRTRAFALAILGYEDEAISIAETMLPARLANRLAPFLSYMPRLSAAQQAAAGNLGRFPRTADIGREDVTITRRVDRSRSARPARAVDARLIPQGPAMGQENQPGETELERAVRQQAQAAAPIQDEDLHDHDQPVEEEAGEDRPDLTQAFADFSLEEIEEDAEPAPGAVDITSIEPGRDAPPEPEPPAHPRRHWVQVATGQNTSAFRFDWRRIQRNSGGLLDRMDAFRVRWNRTNRLVTGPFDSANEAQAMVSALRREGVSTFRFTSQQGEVVTPIN